MLQERSLEKNEAACHDLETKLAASRKDYQKLVEDGRMFEAQFARGTFLGEVGASLRRTPLAAARLPAMRERARKYPEQNICAP